MCINYLHRPQLRAQWYSVESMISDGSIFVTRFANRFRAQSSIFLLSLHISSTVSCWLHAHLSTPTYVHCWCSCLLWASVKCMHDRVYTVALRDIALQCNWCNTITTQRTRYHSMRQPPGRHRDSRGYRWARSDEHSLLSIASNQPATHFLGFVILELATLLDLSVLSNVT